MKDSQAHIRTNGLDVAPELRSAHAIRRDNYVTSKADWLSSSWKSSVAPSSWHSALTCVRPSTKAAG